MYFCYLYFVPLVSLFLCQYHTVLITIALFYSLKSGNVMPPTLFFFLRLSLVIWGLLWFPINFRGLPRWLSGKESTCQCRRCSFDPWIGMIPWRRKRQPPPVVLPGKSHGQRSLTSYSPRDCKRDGHNLSTKQWQ